MKAARYLLVAAVILLSACTTVTPIATRGEYRPERLVGTWDVRGSTAQFLISQRRTEYLISGLDTADRERFRISDVAWDGRYLTGTFVAPSTQWTTYSRLKFSGPDRLQGPYRGDQKTGLEVWLRQRRTKTSNQAMQRTASKPVIETLRVCHSRFGCVERFTGLAVPDLVSR